MLKSKFINLSTNYENIKLRNELLGIEVITEKRFSKQIRTLQK